MGLGVLLRLLAALQILPRLVSPADPLPAPTVIADPQHSVYFPGERLTLHCSASPGEAVTSYQFYNQSGEQVFTESPEPAGESWLVMTTEVEKAGVYSCEYWAVRDEQNLSSARSQPVRVPVMDLPAAPSISANASGPWDDLVTIVCSFTGNYTSITFQIFRNGNIIKLGVTPTPQGTRLQLHTSDPAIAGSFACSYETDVAGRKAQSRPSSPISIHLPEPPGAPSLSLNPSRTVYLPGETVTLTCSVPPGAHTATGFQFSRDDDWRVSSRSSDKHALIITGLGDSGSYTCAYWIRPSQWGVRSQESQPVSFSVTNLPSQPALSVDPPSGAVSEGLPLNITCTAPGEADERRFHFYKDGAKMVPGAVGSEISSTTEPGIGTRDVLVLRFLQAGPNSSGEFTCGYEENVQGRWVPSPRSLAMNVNVTAKGSPGSTQAWPPLIPLIAGGLGAAAVFSLLLLVWLCRRKKDGVTAQPEPIYINTPPAAGLALQERSPDGRAQPATHNWAAQPSTPRGKPLMGQNPQRRGEREEDVDSRASINVYSMPTYPRSTAQQRGGNSEAGVYRKLLA